MPIYEYECLTCAHRFDEIQKFSDPPHETCPKCSNTVRKLIFPAAVIFKGAGFYATEYGKSKHALSPAAGDVAAGAENKSASKAEGKSESKSGSKPEAKSETKSETKSESCSTSKDKAAAS